MKTVKGMVYIFEGDGKGKTSAALGVALRMLLLGKKVVWISWFKSLKWPISEAKLVNCFPKCLRMFWMGEGFYIKLASSKELHGGAVARDTATKAAHLRAASEGLALARKKLAGSHPPNLMVLDELIRAVNEKLLTSSEVLDLIGIRKATHLVITGHDCPASIRRAADLVTRMVKKKHPYDKGKLAVKGLDF